jgi:hypothetical protein
MASHLGPRSMASHRHRTAAAAIDNAPRGAYRSMVIAISWTHVEDCVNVHEIAINGQTRLICAVSPAPIRDLGWFVGS